MSDLFKLALALLAVTVAAEDVVGYWENWNDVSWWDNYIPGNCEMGCALPSNFIQKTVNYSYVNYGFAFLSENPNPDQDGCTGTTTCPVWDGKGIYVAAASKSGATLVTSSMPADTGYSSCQPTSYVGASPGLVAIGEVCRLARQGAVSQGLPPKRCLLSLGGWSDYAALGSQTNAQAVAKLVGRAVAYGFLDGIDLDFEHLTPFNELYPGEFNNFQTLISSIRDEFNKVASNWYTMAQQRIQWLNCTYNALESWEQSSSYYYPTNIKYMQDILNNPVPYLEISYTTRFNAWVPSSNPFNYLLPTSPVPTTPFDTDNEGPKVWGVASYIDNVNIMAYDGGSSAGPLQLNFTQILVNFEQLGPVPRTKLTMGLEPGEQNGGGVWEGEAADEAVIQTLTAGGYGGVMFWAINENPSLQPNAVKYCPILSGYAFNMMKPTYPYPPAPTFSKISTSTGWSV